MTALFAPQYQNKLTDAGYDPLTSIDQTNATFGEGAAASFRYMRDEGLSTSRGRAFEPYLTARDDEIEKLAGERLTLPYGALQEPWYPEAVDLVRSGELRVDDQRQLATLSPRAKALSSRISPDYLKAIAVRERLRQQYPTRVLSDDEIEGKVQADLTAKRTANQAVMARASGGSQFVGTAAGAMTDPAVLATLPFGAGWQGGRALVNAAKAFGSEFLIGSGSEALIQGEVYDFKKSIESPYTKAEAILNVLAAGAGAGVLRATVGAGIDAGIALKRALAVDGSREALARAGVDPEIAARIVDEIETRAASKPVDVSLQAHSDAVDRAVNAVDEGRLATPPEADAPPMSLSQRIANDAQLRADLEDLNIRSGWSEEGGKAFYRGDSVVNAELEAFGRSSWIPRESWWLERPQGLTEDALDTAVKKALRGERLGPKQQEAVQFLVEIADMRRGNLDYLPEPQELVDEGLVADVGTAHESAMVARAYEIDEPAVDRLAMQFPDDADKFMAGVKEIIDGHAKGPATASGRPPGIAPTEAKAIAGEVRAEAAVRQVDGEPAYPAERAVAEAIAAQPPPKPKVKKDGSPDESPQPPPEDIPDVRVAVGERDDGSIETKPVKQALKEIDDEIRALDRVEACERNAA